MQVPLRCLLSATRKRWCSRRDGQQWRNRWGSIGRRSILWIVRPSTATSTTKSRPFVQWNKIRRSCRRHKAAIKSIWRCHKQCIQQQQCWWFWSGKRWNPSWECDWGKFGQRILSEFSSYTGSICRRSWIRFDIITISRVWCRCIILRTATNCIVIIVILPGIVDRKQSPRQWSGNVFTTQFVSINSGLSRVTHSHSNRSLWAAGQSIDVRHQWHRFASSKFRNDFWCNFQ